MEQTQFTVQTDVFEGPLELLLSLIEKRKVFASDVSLADVAGEYIESVRVVQDFPMADVAGFLLVASTLALVKSKSLLPNLSLTDEEKGDIRNLEERLALYEKVRVHATGIRKRFGESMFFARSVKIRSEQVFAPDEETTVATLRETIGAVISRLPEEKEKVPETTVKKIVSLETMMKQLSQRIEKSLSLSFTEFTGSRVEKVELVVGFLAMLELVKQGVVDVAQESRFGDITIESMRAGTPRYGD
ncbi:MAG: segregation/condensation protein A [Parcubacteria group bacterium]|nr:segregation/condensation protein A [Parcubacteria group bacterium]